MIALLLIAALLGGAPSAAAAEGGAPDKAAAVEKDAPAPASPAAGAATTPEPRAADAPETEGTAGAMTPPGDCGMRPCTPEVPNAPPPPPGKGLRAAAIPVLAYGSDTGWRIAGGLFLYDLAPDELRNDWAAIQLSWTSRGPRYAEVKGEFRDLSSFRFRSFYQLKLHDDVAAPYWGEGAKLGGGPPPGAGSPPEAYQYHVTGPWLAASLRGPLRGPLGWFVRTRWTRRNIHHRGAILEAARPSGYDGGGLMMAGAGVVLDTRNEEVGARRGVFGDASVFATPRWPRWGFSQHALVGANLTAREYVPLWRGATLAFRQLYENKVGDVPFFERTQIEGLGYGEGVGGAGTVRGMARARLAGEEKMLASVELRANVAATKLMGRRLDWGVSLGADAARARQRGFSPIGGAGTFAGLRLVWDRAVLIRFEVGNAGQGGAAYYLSFDEPF